jgi:hypothetical protein
MHVNKVHHVTTITRVAEDLGEDEDWLRDVANEMEIEDGVIWVYGVGEDGVMAFTDFGIETLMELIRIHKEPQSAPPLTSAYQQVRTACGLTRMDTVEVLRLSESRQTQRHRPGHNDPAQLHGFPLPFGQLGCEHRFRPPKNGSLQTAGGL